MLTAAPSQKPGTCPLSKPNWFVDAIHPEGNAGVLCAKIFSCVFILVRHISDGRSSYLATAFEAKNPKALKLVLDDGADVNAVV